MEVLGVVGTVVVDFDVVVVVFVVVVVAGVVEGLVWSGVVSEGTGVCQGAPGCAWMRQDVPRCTWVC